MLSISYAATKDAEKRLAEENAALDSLSRMKSNYMANISHELKTPLTIMGGYAQLSEWDIKDNVVSEDTFIHLRKISEEAGRLAQLVSGMLNVAAHIEDTITFAPARPQDIINEAAVLYKSILTANNNRIVIYAENNNPLINANYGMVLQVIVNLINNANRHTKGGTITITLRRDDVMAVFIIEDNGEGISDEILNNIFQRGVSGAGSTGLGLPICKEIVETHGGEIVIESEINKGTAVTFTIPLYKEDSQA